jgi:hypothetical protein
MPKKRFGAEQIVTLLRQLEVSMAQGKSAPEACDDPGIVDKPGLLGIAVSDWRITVSGLTMVRASTPLEASYRYRSSGGSIARFNFIYQRTGATGIPSRSSEGFCLRRLQNGATMLD